MLVVMIGLPLEEQLLESTFLANKEVWQFPGANLEIELNGIMADNVGNSMLTVSTPPSTIPSPTTTELSRKAWDVLTEINNSIDGNPSSLTFQNGKGSKIGK
ncbi:hypothetical protein PV327_008200 [Microctonus hyperodae]|uniref:Uncharacterized protein n=1 Tax=Microctonus hyperodae TaxID=165561 RepID=A0AA39KGY2_MICHY|nr:hypothetical protein PV327_008200 [Microctonus hyperodae]